MTELILENKRSIRDCVASALIGSGNGFVDRVLGVAPRETLNIQPWFDGPPKPAQALLKAARALQAEAIDP